MAHYVSSRFQFGGDSDVEVTDEDRAEALAAGVMIGPRCNRMFVGVSEEQFLYLSRHGGLLIHVESDGEEHGVALGQPSDWDPDLA